jgi:hypothetical protein
MGLSLSLLLPLSTTISKVSYKGLEELSIVLYSKDPYFSFLVKSSPFFSKTEVINTFVSFFLVFLFTFFSSYIHALWKNRSYPPSEMRKVGRVGITICMLYKTTKPSHLRGPG